MNQEEIEKEIDLRLFLTVCVVEIFTTDGINFSAKSAKDSGFEFAFRKILDLKLKKQKYFFIFI